jgi:hypothetical protein
MPKLYQRQNIQNLLKNACTVESLTRYCYDLPALKLVYQRLAAETSLLERVDWLMQSAEDDTLDLILNQLQQDQPTLYARYQPYDYPTQVTVPNISRHRSNPFTYGNAISDTARFIGRQREIEQIQSRLLNAEFESSSIVGERRIGKTSLLKYLARPEVTIAAGFAADAYIFVYSDLQMLGPNRKPTDFWRRVLRQTRQFVADSFLQQLINEISAEPVIDTFLLDDLFSEVDNQGLHIVLLLDEFERVTQNTSFDVDFFSGLRAMAIHHNLALLKGTALYLHENVDTWLYLTPVTASLLDQAQKDRKTYQLPLQHLR